MGFDIDAWEVVGAHPVDDFEGGTHCDSDLQSVMGSLSVIAVGGETSVLAFDGGTAETAPYSTDFMLVLDETQPTSQTFTQHWMAPDIFTVTTTLVGSAIHVEWSPAVDPGNDGTDIQLAVRRQGDNTDLAVFTLADSGMADLPETTIRFSGLVEVRVVRTNPLPPNNTLAITSEIWYPYGF